MKSQIIESSDGSETVVHLGTDAQRWGELTLPRRSTANGVITFSVSGQRHSTSSFLATEHAPEVGDHVRALGDIWGAGYVTERFVNLSDLRFATDKDPIELALSVSPDQGLLVLVDQRSPSGQSLPTQYLVPTKESVPTRKQLTYDIPIEPRMISNSEASGEYVLRILLFDQPVETETRLFDRMMRSTGLSEGADDYQVLIYHENNFVPVTDGGQVAADKHTLLLVHGTFSTTAHSFEKLIESGAISQLLRQGLFEQVIAFDHPTIVHNADQNVAELLTILRRYSLSFNHPMAVMTTSRGALVAHSMCSNATLLSYIRVSRVVCFSAANGCGYFRVGQHLSRFLGIWKMTLSGAALKAILSVAQLSAEQFLNQPGCRLMNPETGEVRALLRRRVVHPVRYSLVVSDWHSCLSAEEGWFEHLSHTVLDRLIRTALGKRHDWVIGCREQELYPTGAELTGVIRLHCVHGRYLEGGYVRDAECRVLESIVELVVGLVR